MCDRALRKRNSDLLNIFEGILFFILHNTAFKKMQMMSQIMAVNGGLSLQLGKLADFFSGLNGNCGKQQIFLLSRWLLSVTIKTHDYLEKLVFAHGILL